MTLRIGVATVTHGRRACVERLLTTVGALDPAPCGVWCVVQADPDGTAAMVRERFARVHVVELGENRGVWGGMNAAYGAAFGGAGQGAPDVLVMVDDDALFVDAGALGVICEIIARDDRLGVLQARLVEEGRADEGEIPLWRAEWTGGANAMRRAVWEQCGPYPAWFFRSAGETVLAHRALARGWRCLYAPRFVLEHRPEMRGRDLARFHGDSIRNRYLAAAMTMGPLEWPTYWAGHFVRSVARRFTGRPGRPLRALLGALALLPRALRERTYSAEARRRYKWLKRARRKVEEWE